MEKGKDLVVVMGATGKQGGAVARKLLARGHKVRAVTRKPDGDSARAITALGAEVVKGDLDDAASLERACQGAWGIFAVQNTWEAGVALEEEQGKRVAEVARRQGVRHFVYASVGSAHRKTGIPHFDNKWRVEEAVRSLGFPSYTILRPVFFMENFLLPSLKPRILDGKLMMALEPKTVLQMIAVENIGEFGLRAFEQHEGMNGRAVDIAGDQHTMPETAEILGQALGRKLEFVRVPIEEIRKFSEDYALMLEWFGRVGYDVDIPKLARDSGIGLTTLADWAAKTSWA